jgi:PAS domain S-box-containing protein/putative nucleotidyltransferase with HDIG domain
VRLSKSEFELAVLLLRNGVTLIADDAARDARVSERLAEIFSIRSVIGLPLIVDRERYGCIFLTFSQSHHFTPEEVSLGEQAAGQVAMAAAKARLHAETRSKAAELGRLYAATQEMTASLLDPPALLHTLAHHIADALNVTSSYMISVNKAEGTMTTLAEYWADEAAGPERKSDMGAIFQIRDYPTIMRAMFAGEVLLLHDGDPRLAELERRQFADYAVKSMLCIPIFAHGKLLGNVEIWESRRRREYTLAEIRLAQGITTQAASIIENAQLFARTRQRESELATVLNVAQAVSSSLELKDVLKQAATSMAYILCVDYCILSEYDSVARTINTSARYSWDGKVDQTSDRDIIYPLDDYPVSESVMVGGEATVIRADDPQADPAEVAFLQKYGYGISLLLPLRVHDTPLGLVELCSFDPRREFKPEEIRLALALADQVAIAIDNARLYNRLEQSEAHFRALIENAAEGVAVLDAQGNFRYLTHQEQSLTGYTFNETIGQSAFRFIHPDDLPDLAAAFQEGAQTPGSIITREYRLQRKDGTWHHYEVTGHNLLHDPHVAGVVINYRDITERKQAEAEVQRYASELAQAYDNTLVGWARALELRDELTEGHTRRVTELTLQLARVMGLPESDLVHIRRGAILHDIGKMAIPDSILLKRGALTPEEQVIMFQHPQHAYDMLYSIEFLRPALDIPFCHHEKWDGSGYPRGLRGAQIPLAARIFSVADVWDAVTSDRPYRPAWPHEVARQYLAEQSGTHFDPKIVEIFLSLGLE